MLTISHSSTHPVLATETIVEEVLLQDIQVDYILESLKGFIRNEIS